MTLANPNPNIKWVEYLHIIEKTQLRPKKEKDICRRGDSGLENNDNKRDF